MHNAPTCTRTLILKCELFTKKIKNKHYLHKAQLLIMNKPNIHQDSYFKMCKIHYCQLLFYLLNCTAL